MGPRLSEVLRALPFVEDDHYLGMQALSLGIVDAHIKDLESELLHQYLDQERTPWPLLLLVNGLSQLWVFGLYELLRTWRQRATSVLRFADEIRGLRGAKRKARLSEQQKAVNTAAGPPERQFPVHWQAYESAALQPAVAKRIRRALDRSELPFRKIEALRVHLAKHEVPKAKGLSFATGPGVGGIDPTTGSIYWQVDLGNMQVDVSTRRGLAEMCEELGRRRRPPILPQAVQAQVAKLPQHSYGVRRARLRIKDGREIETYVAWNKQVVWVPGFDVIPFDAQDVIAALPPQVGAAG